MQGNSAMMQSAMDDKDNHNDSVTKTGALLA
jgi:hypothetical protein